MSNDKRKIVERLRKKGLIGKDSLNMLMKLALEENEKQTEQLKKNSINLLLSQNSVTKEQFLSLLAEKLQKC